MRFGFRFDSSRPLLAMCAGRKSHGSGRRLVAVTALLASLFVIAPASVRTVLGQPQTVKPDATLAKSARYKNGCVVAVSKEGAEVGASILRKGGNAVDAAIATALAMAVTFPEAGNIGGGGFMLVSPGPGRELVLIDYREVAPSRVGRETFLREWSMKTHKVVGVPGTVRGLALAHQKFGKLPWKDLVRPAWELAHEGFEINSKLALSLNAELGRTVVTPEFARCYRKAPGKFWKGGDRLVQPDLAWSMRQIMEHGPDAFYTGEIADKLVAEMEQGGGFIRKDDLAKYEAKVRVPQHVKYRDYDVYSTPAPAGGVVLAEMLNIVETLDLRKHDRWSPRTVHALAEAMRRGYADRARYLGDPDFTKIPAELTTKDYARTRAEDISFEAATPSKIVAPEIPLVGESSSTTHFSVIDSTGMAVANTYTLEESYGSRIVVKGAGFLLNNEMGDFNWKPGITDRTGRIGTAPNEVAPGKRMLSSQTPTIVLKQGKVHLVTGSPGGRTIINTVLSVLVNTLEYDMDLETAVAAPRMHHQWFPDGPLFEQTLYDQAPELLAKLRDMGHVIPAKGRAQGDAHSIGVDGKTGEYIGVADQRRDGHTAGY